MPINRAPWNALVDDDGSNTVGTIFSKQDIKDVILDPADAAYDRILALGSASGSVTVGGQIAFIAIPQLTLADALRISVIAVNTSGAAIDIDLRWYDPASATVIPAITLTGAAGVGTFNPSHVLHARVDARPLPPGPANVIALAAGTLTVATTQFLGTTFGVLSTPNFLTAGGSFVYLYTGSLTAMNWAWSVHLLKG